MHDRRMQLTPHGHPLDHTAPASVSVCHWKSSHEEKNLVFQHVRPFKTPHYPTHTYQNYFKWPWIGNSNARKHRNVTDHFRLGSVHCFDQGESGTHLHWTNNRQGYSLVSGTLWPAISSCNSSCRHHTQIQTFVWYQRIVSNRQKSVTWSKCFPQAQVNYYF